ENLHRLRRLPEMFHHLITFKRGRRSLADTNEEVTKRHRVTEKVRLKTRPLVPCPSANRLAKHSGKSQLPGDFPGKVGILCRPRRESRDVICMRLPVEESLQEF